MLAAKNKSPGLHRRTVGALLLGLTALLALPADAQPVELTITVQGNKFSPAELNAPANTPITLRVKNLDPTPIEFESRTLRVEKVMTGNSEITINVRAQKPGRYEFFDEYHENTTRGVLVVK